MIQPTATNRAEFLAECQSEAFSGIEAIYRTYGSARITGLFDEELVAALPKSCRFVCHKGALPLTHTLSLFVSCPFCYVGRSSNY